MWRLEWGVSCNDGICLLGRFGTYAQKHLVIRFVFWSSPPGDKDGTMENEQYFEGLNKGSIYKVKQAFAILGVPMDLVRIAPGWFDPTLKTSALDRIAILHIDADWYESVKFVLQALYEKVVPGGFIVLDDYGYWEGCKRALTDFFAERGIKDLSIERIGRQGVYFQKPLQGNMQRVGSIRLVL